MIGSFVIIAFARKLLASVDRERKPITQSITRPPRELGRRCVCGKPTAAWCLDQWYVVVYDRRRKAGILYLSQRLIELDAHRTTSQSKHYVYDIEAMKYVAMQAIVSTTENATQRHAYQ